MARRRGERSGLSGETYPPTPFSREGRGSGRLDIFFELALDSVVLRAAGRRFAAGSAGAARRRARRGVELLADLEHRRLERIFGAADALNIVGGEGGAHVRDLGFDIALDVGRDLVAQVAQRLLRLVGGVVGLVAHLDLVAAAAVIVGV